MNVTVLTLCLSLLAAGDDLAPERVRISDRLPYGWKVIDYQGAEASDAVAKLRERLEAGTFSPRFREGSGYLKDVLAALEIPVSSQVLVYSKTAVNRRFVSPENPRAIYFNDDVYVGWVPGASALEIAASDPKKGPLFYTWPLREGENVRPTRDDSCLTCHASAATLQVPGLFVQSFETDRGGRPTSGYRGITHNTPYKKRWGGWYVTGRHGELVHLANHFGAEANLRRRKCRTLGANKTSLEEFTSLDGYLSKHSDIVAHMVLNHQVQAHNLITRVNYEFRLNRRSDAEKRLLRYMLFTDEPRLPSPVSGTTDYAKWFQRKGLRDGEGRSLRDLDLKTRLLKYRLSYLVYSESFQALPEPVLKRFFAGLEQVLAGTHPDEDFQTIPEPEREAIREILRDTNLWPKSKE